MEYGWTSSTFVHSQEFTQQLLADQHAADLNIIIVQYAISLSLVLT
jgi:hypothetical protein